MQFPSLRQVLAAFALALLARGAGAAELVVIVSARSPIGPLRADQVADIFLGQVGRFPDGAEAFALDQAVGSPLRNEFYDKVAAKTPALMKAHWARMIFTGRGQPPREAQGSAAVRKLVAENPALIGYIDKSALDASVKPVLLVH
ncbi:phosphate ABC transporter substrate-binding protein [Massilia sp. R2A-15]|uniref:phosphate ABC transporter substrate-binding protein n=1 Tax=Massilia sp. R2A-15 TaxID=3064278 RepID=UPI002735680D|nr:phosphate ABC transporter substrate-binding protein [Massilia sp. R2A-15]WLI90477.1 phosphate ABC transporter substrate-binding protein [Massilia sp. R2A-15]